MTTAGAADLANARVTIALDLRHPLSYLALAPAQQLESELDEPINWLPISVPPLKAPTVPVGGTPTVPVTGTSSTPTPEFPVADDRGVRHRRNRAHAIAREIEVYGEAQGLVVRDYYRSGTAECANRGWLWMRTHCRDRLAAYLSQVFRRYWCVELDVADDAAIAACIGEIAGIAAADDYLDWSSRAGAQSVVRVTDELAEAGIFSSPAYVIDGEVFYGRQHLAMIRWILAGRNGPVPI